MLLEYIKNNYDDGEPILLEEIEYKNKEALRQEMKRLTDNGTLVRAYSGVYYKAYKTIFNTEGKMSIDKYSELNESELRNKLKEYVQKTNVNFDIVKDIIGLYPDRVYKNIYNGGLMNELIK